MVVVVISVSDVIFVDFTIIMITNVHDNHYCPFQQAILSRDQEIPHKSGEPSHPGWKPIKNKLTTDTIPPTGLKIWIEFVPHSQKSEDANILDAASNGASQVSPSSPCVTIFSSQVTLPGGLSGWQHCRLPHCLPCLCRLPQRGAQLVGKKACLPLTATFNRLFDVAGNFLE